MPRRIRAFTLIELLVVIAIIALLIGILLPALGEARRVARMAVCGSHLQQLGVAYQSYATDFTDRLASFTWQPGRTYGEPPYSYYVAPGGTYAWTTAASNQAADIIRRRGDRPDIQPDPSRMPHRHYSHLVVNEYLSRQLPEIIMSCTEDRVLMRWQKDPRAVLDPTPLGPPGPSGKWWPYSSSYQIVPAAWSPDQGDTVSQYPADHNLFWEPSPNCRRGKRKASEIFYPSAKVIVFEFIARHGRRPLYHGHTRANVPAMMWDGSCGARKSAEANRGFIPTNPAGTAATQYQYAPGILGFEPPTSTGAPTETVWGYFRWTRGGLKGVDYGGNEIDTGQMP